MAYLSQWRLTYDDDFVSRCRACLIQQAEQFKDDTRADIVAMAESIIRQDNGSIFASWQATLGAAPSFADTADPDGDGTVDSSLITDAMILANVQAQWPTLAALYFDDTGAPI
jgi:hypothetical protein